MTSARTSRPAPSWTSPPGICSASGEVVGRKDALCRLIVNGFARSKALPQVIRRWKTCEVVVTAGQEIVLDDSVAVRGVRELQSQYLGVFLRLLESVSRLVVYRLRLNHRDWEIAAITRQIVQTFLQ